ncbi:HD domain-containing protein [Kocuria nitroreducens]|uniref:HD domain-containing protein n=1 Tax=Kocuria nitroreducens TaxID=3058914 RepID=UPI0036D7A7D6
MGAGTVLLRQLGDLKRLRDARGPGSLADRAFVRGWRRLVQGEEFERIALEETARALVATRLAGVDGSVLRRAGLDRAESLEVLERAFDAALEVGGPELGDTDDLRAVLPQLVDAEDGAAADRDRVPAFVLALVDQPRAGATHPSTPRIIVEPPESHGDHCFVTAVYSALLAPRHGVDRGDAFVVAMAHHLPNGDLPDAGYAGEVLLGEHYLRILDALERRSLGQLPEELARRLRTLLPQRETAETPVGRVFNAADVLDRVLQVHHHARAAAFTASQALGDLDIVHPGTVQTYQLGVLADAGLGAR